MTTTPPAPALTVQADGERIRIDGHGAIPPDLILRRRGTEETGAPPQVTGDDDFDRQVETRGDEAMVLALLDDETRRAVRTWVYARGAEVGKGALLVPAKTGSAARQGTPRGLVGFAKRLCLPAAEAPDRLLRNATTDNHPAVRVRNLKLLQGRFGGGGAAHEASRAALRSPAMELRLVGAVFLQREGVPAARAVVRSARAAPGVRLRALEHVIEYAPLGGPEAAAVLEELLHATRWLESTPAGIRSSRSAPAARGGTCDPEAEAVLLRLVGQGAEEVKSTALGALRRCGSAAAVETLLPLTRGRGGPLKRAAQAAVAAIQARLEGAEAGQLTIAEAMSAAGGLSVAGEAGSLTVARPAPSVVEDDDEPGPAAR